MQFYFEDAPQFKCKLEIVVNIVVEGAKSNKLKKY
jgi:hypothetical protein